MRLLHTAHCLRKLILAAVFFFRLVESTVWRTDFSLKKREVPLIKWFSTVQQFFEKIVKCLGPLDQSDKCCQVGKMLPLNGSLKKENVSQGLTSEQLWFPLPLCFINVSLSSSLIVKLCTFLGQFCFLHQTTTSKTARLYYSWFRFFYIVCFHIFIVFFCYSIVMFLDFCNICFYFFLILLPPVIFMLCTNSSKQIPCM